MKNYVGICTTFGKGKVYRLKRCSWMGVDLGRNSVYVDDA